METPSYNTEFLYLDNFRGFDTTLIPLSDFTFFVGENSTGKSSVMSMLHLVRNFSFWLEPDFDTDDQHLGGFNDLITTGSKKKQFTVGSARYQKSFSDKITAFIIFATFSNREGLPYISKLSFAGKSHLKTVITSNNNIFYKETDLQNPLGVGILNEEWLRMLIRQHDATNEMNSKGIEFRPGLNFPLLHMFSYIDQLAGNKKKKNGDNPKNLETGIPEIYQFMSPADSSVWLAPIRTKPKRTYDGTKKAFSSEGDHTPHLLKSQLNTKPSANKFKKLICKLGLDSHLFDDISIKSFGSGESAPFEVQVNLNGALLGLSNVGYGVSQVLPILAEIIARNNSYSFHIQQPEVHLHPRAQAALGDLFYTLAADQKKKFVIETHSDFLIDRFRSAIESHQSSAPPINASVVFFSRKSKRNTIHELPLAADGSYPRNQPDAFREFFIHEQLRNLNI